MNDAVKIQPPVQLPPIVGSLAAMGQVLAGAGLNAHGITVSFPGPIWVKLQAELKVEDALRKIDAPLTMRLNIPGLMAPMEITMKKAERLGSIVLA